MTQTDKKDYMAAQPPSEPWQVVEAAVVDCEEIDNSLVVLRWRKAVRGAVHLARKRYWGLMGAWLRVVKERGQTAIAGLK